MQKKQEMKKHASTGSHHAQPGLQTFQLDEIEWEDTCSSWALNSHVRGHKFKQLVYLSMGAAQA